MVVTEVASINEGEFTEDVTLMEGERSCWRC